jgi:hypothetical protein
MEKLNEANDRLQN